MKWIDVNENPPKENGEYLVKCLSFQGETWWQEATYTSGKWRDPYYGQEMIPVLNSVTHWFNPELLK